MVLSAYLDPGSASALLAAVLAGMSELERRFLIERREQLPSRDRVQFFARPR